MDFDNPISPEQPIDRVTLSRKIIPLKSELGDLIIDDYTLRGKSQEERERFEKVLKGARAVGENRTRFWNMLVSTVARTDYAPPENRQTQVLDLACGRCEEGIVLSAFFGGGEYGSATDQVKVTGIDIKQSDIEGGAIRDYQMPDCSNPITTYYLPDNFEFIHGDATDLDQYPQVPQQVDVVVIRHQQISDNEQVWSKIFQQALNRVTPEGIVLITSFSDVEHKMLLEALGRVDCDVVLTERNQFAKTLSHEKISLDRNIAIVKRK